MEKFYRNCPKCKKELSYPSLISLRSALKKNTNCMSCSAKEVYLKRGYSKLDQINIDCKKGIRENGFKGKKHKPETIEKLKNRDTSCYKTEEFRSTMSSVTKGSKNGMYGRTVMQIWVEKFGQEEAELKLKDYKNKVSKNSSGSKNPMYGKQSPQGSGNGWSGWYKGWFFRSLIELSYMVNVIERFNLKWVSAEAKIYKIDYIGFKNQSRTYFADFVINDKYLVEIKPKKLHKSKTVILKSEAAVIFCKDRGMVYKISDCPKLSSKDLEYLINDGTVILTDRYKEKYEKFKRDKDSVQ